MMMNGMMDCAVMGWLGLLLGVAALVLIVFAAVWLVRQLIAGARPVDAAVASVPLGELDRRYARGEIDRETYLSVRRDLTES